MRILLSDQMRTRCAPFRMLSSRAVGYVIVCTLALVSGAFSGGGAEQSKHRNKVDFNRDIRPLLSENCYKCHGPDDGVRKAKLRFDVRAEALKPAKSGEVPIVPGSLEKSQLVARVTASDPDDRMPPLKT